MKPDFVTRCRVAPSLVAPSLVAPSLVAPSLVAPSLAAPSLVAQGLVALLVLWPPALHAQEHHERHHAYYQNWVNKQNKGCCNDQDCGELREEDERNTRDGVEVRIEGQWCPVQSFHYLKRGNAPNWTASHVCVQKYQSPLNTSVCERLLCYQPKPGI